MPAQYLTGLGQLKSNTQITHVAILNRIRLIAIAGQLALILIARYYLKIDLPLLELLLLLSAEISFQFYSWYKVRSQRSFPSYELLLHLVFDTLLLSSMIYLTGGSNNPFLYLLLLSTALATFMLDSKALAMLAVVQVLCYTWLHFYQRPLVLAESSPLHSYHLHLAGMWINFILTVILIVVFGLIARQALWIRERKIQSMQQQQLKDEQLLSLGIMSASAAHELGTPLATMAVIVEDLQHSELPEEYQSDLLILANQIEASRKILQSLADKSRNTKGLSSANTPSSQTFKQQLTDTFEQWLVYRPQMKLEQLWQPSIESIQLQLPISAEQAIINLLDNAADAGLENGKDTIMVNCREQEACILIEILDSGQGISTQLAANLGSDLQLTDKVAGMGWGFFLSNASIERIGGKVQLVNRAEGGTATRIFVPKLIQQEPNH